MLVKHSQRTVKTGCKHCGSTDLYWAHDTDVTTDRNGFKLRACSDCGVTGRFTLIDANSFTRSVKRGQSVSDVDRHYMSKSDADQAATPEPTSEDESESEVPVAYVRDDAKVDALAAQVAMLAAKLDTVTAQLTPKRELPALSHNMLSDVILDLDAGEHVMMVGPAGTGKSQIAKSAAKALGLDYYELSLNPGMTATVLLGYMSADGTYIRTLFREAFENGGVFHFDEIDNGHPSTLATMNAGLANGEMAFPDKMVKRHPSFRCVASANTYGRGADRQYVGRQQIDAATLDRFVVEEINVDEALESAICEALYAKSTEVISYVRKLRANAEAHKMPVIVSPRASIGMCKLLAAGKSWDAALNARVRKGLSESDWGKLTSGAYAPYGI